MKIKWHSILMILGILFVGTAPVMAQTPRPTPTNIPTDSSTSSNSDPRGSVFGSVYLDVNGDGSCVNTGVEGEVPVEGVSLQFSSSNATTTIPLKTGTDGSFGLVAAGESNWEVLVIANANQVVTSQNPVYVPVYEDGALDHSGVNFCIAANSGPAMGQIIDLNSNAIIVTNENTTETVKAEAIILNPDSGAPAPNSAANVIWLVGLTLVGFAFIVAGLAVECKRRM